MPPADVSRRQIRIARSADSVQGVRSLSGSPAAEHAASYELRAKQLGRRPRGAGRRTNSNHPTESQTRPPRSTVSLLKISLEMWALCRQTYQVDLQSFLRSSRTYNGRESRPLELFRCNLVFLSLKNLSFWIDRPNTLAAHTLASAQIDDCVSKQVSLHTNQTKRITRGGCALPAPCPPPRHTALAHQLPAQAPLAAEKPLSPDVECTPLPAWRARASQLPGARSLDGRSGHRSTLVSHAPASGSLPYTPAPCHAPAPATHPTDTHFVARVAGTRRPTISSTTTEPPRRTCRLATSV